ncbi:MAG: threonine/serine dehydratase [Anaerolineales bacterium]
MIPYVWFAQAAQRIAPYIVETPLTYDADRDLYLKWENRQTTGSFKPRGALNKVLTLDDWERKAGLVAASAGNHGQGVALAGQVTGSHVEVFVPEHAPNPKVEGMRSLGAQVHFVQGGYGEAESAAKTYAARRNKTFVSPYNDAQVIAGQGTVFVEALRQLASMQREGATDSRGSSSTVTWVVPTGGGGLISSCGIVLQNQGRGDRVVGVQPAASAFTYSLYHHGTQAGVEDGPTLADGLSGAIDSDSVTIPMLHQFVDDIVVVTEESIANAIALAWRTYHERIEGSGAAGLAAALGEELDARPAIVVISGGNIEDEIFDRITGQQAGGVPA